MHLQPNTLFHDRYCLLEMKGRGSFGEVWLARDSELDLNVAVKVYIALDRRGVEEFKSEFKTAFGLNHPNLLHAYHYEVFEDRPYLVMPYCPNSAINLVGNVEEPTMWRFVRDVSSGLAYLHEMGVVHHDIKPENILIDDEGKFFITDFGISVKFRSTLRRNSTKKAESGFRGTVPYMAPEMFDSRAESVNATDIWALGVTMYELMTGELPFFGQGGAMMLNGAKVPEVPGNWSDGLKHVVRKCLQANTWDRPTAKQLVDYAQDCLNGKVLDFGKNDSENVETNDGPQFEDGNTDDNRHEDKDSLVDDKKKDPIQKRRPKWLPYTIIVGAAVLIGLLAYVFMKPASYTDPKTQRVEAKADKKRNSLDNAQTMLLKKESASKGLALLQELMKGEDAYEATFLMSRLYFDPLLNGSKGAEFYKEEWETMRANCGLVADNAQAHGYLMQAYAMKGENISDCELLYELGCDFLFARGIPKKEWGKARWCFERIRKLSESDSKAVPYKNAIKDDWWEAIANSTLITPSSAKNADSTENEKDTLLY